jgi:HPt (histidine-containing phosphotransfer) domain-containing protein
VAVTAHVLDEHAEDCRRAGMSDHLAKPYTQSELLAVVARAASAHHASEPVLDPDSMAQLAATVGQGPVEQLLDRLALRIEALLRRIEDPNGNATQEELADLAHELAGSGGTLGFSRLASSARRFEAAAASYTADIAELRDEAVAALTELRRRRSLEAMLSV